MKKIHRKKRFDILTFSIISICLLIVFLSIGFSSFANSLRFGSIGAIVRVEKDIRVTNFSLSSSSNGGSSIATNYNTNQIFGDINLPNSNSTVTYEVEITNLGNVEMSLYDILNVPSNLSYTISDYTLDDNLCDDIDNTVCKLGSVSTIHITIGYAQNGYDSSIEDKTFSFGLNLRFHASNATARVGNEYFNSLDAAIKSVTTSDPTTVYLLRDTTEELEVKTSQNIILDLGEYTLHNVSGRPVIEITGGTLTMVGGFIYTDSTQGAINVRSGTTFTITGGRIDAVGTKQAIYNEGTTIVDGNPVLTNVAGNKAVIQNQANCTLKIYGGTLIASGFHGVENKGTLEIGRDDGTVSISSPEIIGRSNGVSSTVNYAFYDGIIKGYSAAVNNESRINPKPNNYDLLKSTEVIGQDTYKTIRLTTNITITFDPNEGSVSEPTRSIGEGSVIGPLPVPTRTNYVFLGWFDENDVEVSADTTFSTNAILTAKWIHSSQVVTARIGQTEYSTLQAAITAATGSSQVQIDLARDTSEALIVPSSKNILINLNGYTLRNLGNNPVIDNSGRTEITNGIISSNVDFAAIDNNSNATLKINDASIITTGTRQTIYNNNGGIVEIRGNSYLSSSASGKPGGNSTMERGAIQNLTGGTLRIFSGTIIGTVQQAISNEGTLVIGVQDGSIDTTNPIIQGKTYGIKSSVAYEFYDGIVKGVSSSVLEGTQPTTEANATQVTTTELIGSTTYNVVYYN